VRFLVDAQLPRRLALFLRAEGHDVVHTLDLPEGNRTSDLEINIISVRDERVVITKDADFVVSFLVLGEPFKLLLISTGNITNAELAELFTVSLPAICREFEAYDFLELTGTGLLVHI